MIVIAILVKLYDKGPVFYKQARLTKGGKVFYVMKFRSMRVDAEKGGVAVWASKDDDRSTRVGRFIRKTRLDELREAAEVRAEAVAAAMPGVTRRRGPSAPAACGISSNPPRLIGARIDTAITQARNPRLMM